MAYAAVLSLQNTIHHFLTSSKICIISTSQEMLESANTVATSLQQTLKRSDDRSSGSKRLDALDGRIRETVQKLEDILEFHERDQYFSSQSESNGDDHEYSSCILPIDLEGNREEIHSLIKMLRMMEEEYVEEVEEKDDDDDDNGVSSRVDFGVEMVGLSDEYAKIKHAGFCTRTRPDDFVVVSICGMAGSGRTLIASAVFDDLCTGEERLFECGAWVTVGPNFEFEEMMLDILAQIDYEMYARWELGDEKNNVGEYLYACLKGRRCMIVLDDVWDARIVQYIVRCFPEHDNGSALMFTTSIKAIYQIPTRFNRHLMPTPSETLVWDILRVVLFGLKSCPPELEEVGKKIARHIQGRALQVYKVILFLWKAQETPECWNMLAADERHPVFVVHDEISELRKIKEGMQQLYNSEFDDHQRIFVAKFMDEMLNFSKDVKHMRMELFPKRFFSGMEIISFYGMAGIGKTTLVKKIYTNPSISHYTNHRAWITLGPKYASEEILVDILAQICPDIDKRRMKEDAGLVKILCAKLSSKKCLIVLDDVWSQKPLHYLKKVFPTIKGKVMLTTRLVKVAHFEQFDKVNEVRLLNLEESWGLFCRKVFVNELCPLELEKVGRKISENCEGLPLLILTVADLLSKGEKTLEYWTKVAEKRNSLFRNAQSEISKRLLPSFHSSLQHLKMLFLYMGIFPESYQIPVSKLFDLWNAEGFHEPNSCQNVEDFVSECLIELAERSLVISGQTNSNFGVKNYHLHCSFWYLSTCEALKKMLFYALDTYPDDLVQDINSHRRLCIRNNILLSIKEVRHTIASASSARSLLSNGPPHQYQVPIYYDLRLLRVMDALTIRLYEFPNDIVKLFHLRYLALTYNGKLPGTISKLWNLQYLVVIRHLCIKSSEDASYLPAEIWDMTELRHLQIMGGRLPNPSCGAVLPNLLTLLDINAQSCTKRVLKSTPNLKKLGIQIELSPDSDSNTFRCLNRIWCLHKLESLKCVVVNPELSSKVVKLPPPRSMFPPSLKRLSLSGLGYPWKYMSIIGKLHNLEVLKLHCYAFRGPKWEITDNSHFARIKFFSVSDTDLEHWGINIYTLPRRLEHLSFKHCYKLKKLPDYLNFSINKIEIVDCNPWVVTWAKQIKEFSSWRPCYSNLLQVQSSWDADGQKQ